jgi:hypothetical protein
VTRTGIGTVSTELNLCESRGVWGDAAGLEHLSMWRRCSENLSGGDPFSYVRATRSPSAMNGYASISSQLTELVSRSKTRLTRSAEPAGLRVKERAEEPSAFAVRDSFSPTVGAQHCRFRSMRWSVATVTPYTWLASTPNADLPAAVRRFEFMNTVYVSASPACSHSGTRNSHHAWRDAQGWCRASALVGLQADHNQLLS